MANGNTGISILSKKIFGQFLIMSQPQIIVNGQIIQNLRWNHEIFVPLQPGFQHQIEINFPYILGPSCRAIMVVFLQPGEIQRYRYKTSFFVTSSGKISRIG
ncbi:MAG: hypothetical protein VX473_02960 [Candidatus Thermoplasmatota archaeon]|nr:hypothetical protein [Candidatus Thermoplasmatota archaeon]